MLGLLAHAPIHPDGAPDAARRAGRGWWRDVPGQPGRRTDRPSADFLPGRDGKAHMNQKPDICAWLADAIAERLAEVICKILHESPSFAILVW
jgi:hypothetical protein